MIVVTDPSALADALQRFLDTSKDTPDGYVATIELHRDEWMIVIDALHGAAITKRLGELAELARVETNLNAG